MHTVVRSWVHNDSLSESAVLVNELSSHRWSVYVESASQEEQDLSFTEVHSHILYG